jgi:nucleoside-diphosphate-sugar epimerase
VNLLITGGSGFLGSALALHFLEAGHRVALLLRPTSQLSRLRGREGAFALGRCDSGQEINEFISSIEPDAVIHTACAYGRQGESLVTINDVNLRLGLAILQAVLSVKKPVTFINTGTVLEANVSPYALTKHQFAQWGRFLALQSTHELRFVNVLLQHMYGPGDDSSKFTTHVLNTCHRNEPTLKLTAGEQKRDFLYIDDVVTAYSTLLEKRNDLASAVDIEVGSGTAPSIREFVQTVHKLTASKTELQYGALPYRLNEPMHLQADISQMNALGWQPKFNLERGLRRTLELEFNE